MTQIALRPDRSVMIADTHEPKSLTSMVQDLGKGVSARTVKMPPPQKSSSSR